MINNIFSDVQAKWNTKLQECLENKGYTQASFAEKLNDRYRLDYDNKKRLNQSDVSRWLHVGDIHEGRPRIGFPEFKNMLMIAHCLEVDIGYLIGETNAETFTLKQASDFLHLKPEALNNLKRIIEENSLRNIYIYSEVLNKLFCSKYFEEFIEALNDLEDTYAMYKSMIPNLSEINEKDLDSTYLNCLIANLFDKYGETILEKAWEHYDITDLEKDPFSLTKKEREAATVIGKIPFSFMKIFMECKGDWRTKIEKLLLLKRELQSPIPLGGDSLTAVIKEIEQISEKYSDAVLEKAWEYHKTKEAIKDIKNALDKSYDFSEKLKKDISYARFSVQEKLVLLLNSIYPHPIDSRNKD